MALLEFTEKGIYCPRADIYIDPWRPVARAIITHAHADHARSGMGHYLAHRDSIPIMRHRLGADIAVEARPYGQKWQRHGVEFSLHPAGHIIGSAQVRVAYRGEVWVVSGDYKLEDDGLSLPFEPVSCQHFITESTFGLPVYRWPDPREEGAAINHWWAENVAAAKASLVGAYSLGKAQRVLAALDPSLGPIFTHGAIEQSLAILRQQGFTFPATELLSAETPRSRLRGALILAPPAALGSAWARKLGPLSSAFCSGWMSLRGARRRRGADRGFVISDHADWQGLNRAVEATGAENIYVTHGYQEVFARWLREEKGLRAQSVRSLFEGENLEREQD